MYELLAQQNNAASIAAAKNTQASANKRKRSNATAKLQQALNVSESVDASANVQANTVELIDVTGLTGDALVIAELKNKLALATQTTQRAKRTKAVVKDLTKRDVSCLVNDELKIVYISTRLKNSGCSASVAYNALMRTMKKRVADANYAALVAHEATRYELLVAQVEHGGKEQEEKFAQHNKYVAMGYTVLSTAGRGEAVQVLKAQQIVSNNSNVIVGA